LSEIQNNIHTFAKKLQTMEKTETVLRQPPMASLMVSTYNRPETLNLCLQSIARQTVLPNEVVIGDDGSREETKILIEKFQRDFPIPIIHVWQEDEGFRLAMIRNKAIAKCKYEYIIEVDGDLILNKRFVEDHLYFAKPGCFLKGGRVNLNDKLTKKLCQSQKLQDFNFFTKGLLRRENSIRCMLLSRYLSTRYKKNHISALGANMSFWKKDYIAINGNDEFFIGWGGEDSDFASRMTNSGVKKLYLKFSGIVYHLWHNDLYMQNKEKNFNYYHEQKNNGTIRCEHGVDKYLNT
jgi:glycosyltransferase involved in cell wall biosynthesis